MKNRIITNDIKKPKEYVQINKWKYLNKNKSIHLNYKMQLEQSEIRCGKKHLVFEYVVAFVWNRNKIRLRLFNNKLHNWNEAPSSFISTPEET